MKFKVFTGLATLLIFISLVSCAKDVKPETEAVRDTKADVKEPTKLDIQFRPVYDLSTYLTLKSYLGGSIHYTSEYLTTPESIQAEIEFLADEGITYPKLLHAEILARHHYRFEDAVIQRIFNFTDWYDQHAVRLLRYNPQSLNSYERENLRRLEKIIYEYYPLNYWD